MDVSTNEVNFTKIVNNWARARPKIDRPCCVLPNHYPFGLLCAKESGLTSCANLDTAINDRAWGSTCVNMCQHESTCVKEDLQPAQKVSEMA